MYEPDIEKLRRFLLGVGLVLLTYSIAGISMKPDSEVSVIGLHFNVIPELLPFILIIVSIYSTIRFCYYGFMLKKSPCRLRRDAIEKLSVGSRRIRGGKIKRLPLYFYFGQIKEVKVILLEEDQKKAELYVEDFRNIFPIIFGVRASARLDPDQGHNEDGEETGTVYNAIVSIPRCCRVAAIFQNLDYSLPIWLNLISLAIYLAIYFRIFEGIRAYMR